VANGVVDIVEAAHLGMAEAKDSGCKVYRRERMAIERQ
jgi:hypothetical protein